MYAILEENKVLLWDKNKDVLKKIMSNIPEYRTKKIEEIPDGYVIYDGSVITEAEAEQKEAQKERERINMLSLTAADVERAIYKDKGMDFEDVIEFVKDMPSVDIKALKIELKANNFYRGNPYVEAIGSILGYSSDDLDYLFEHKELPEKVQEAIEEAEEDITAES